MNKKIKIKRNIFSLFVRILIIGLLLYTRFLNLNWGLPFPMHPDERNMADAITRLKCESFNLQQCGNPHFFAYGQFMLYLGYLMAMVIKLIDGNLGNPINFQEAVLSLRLISALSSMINVLVLIEILKVIKQVKKVYWIPFILIIIFSPFFIQFSHFGTTESLLMVFYSLTVLICLWLITGQKKIDLKIILLLSLINGLAVATKISSVIFSILPLIVLTVFKRNFFLLFFYSLFTLLIAIFFSPHNLLNFNEFYSSLMYEKGVADGVIKVFYTQQFLLSKPIIFPMLKVYPYALGQLNWILFLIGFLFTSWRHKNYLFLKLSFLIYFLFSSFLFVKWTRFQAPVLPLTLIFVFLVLEKIKNKFFLLVITLGCLLPGIAYLSVYKNDDVRITASDWLIKNLKNNAIILSETANVVDIPYVSKKNINKNFQLISFNFYDLDKDYNLQSDLKNYLKQADYIIIPSRRVIYNYTCLLNQDDWAYFSNRCPYLKSNHPLLEDYYREVLYDKNNYRLIKTFTSYPQIAFFGKNLIEFPDEAAEETWTVFDHPVIRIYEKINY